MPINWSFLGGIVDSIYPVLYNLILGIVYLKFFLPNSGKLILTGRIIMTNLFKVLVRALFYRAHSKQAMKILPISLTVIGGSLKKEVTSLDVLRIWLEEQQKWVTARCKKFPSGKLDKKLQQDLSGSFSKLASLLPDYEREVMKLFYLKQDFTSAPIYGYDKTEWPDDLKAQYQLVSGICGNIKLEVDKLDNSQGELSLKLESALKKCVEPDEQLSAHVQPSTG